MAGQAPSWELFRRKPGSASAKVRPSGQAAQKRGLETDTKIVAAGSRLKVAHGPTVGAGVESTICKRTASGSSFVSCPICQRQVALIFINRHIDADCCSQSQPSDALPEKPQELTSRSFTASKLSPSKQLSHVNLHHTSLQIMASQAITPPTSHAGKSSCLSSCPDTQVAFEREATLPHKQRPSSPGVGETDEGQCSPPCTATNVPEIMISPKGAFVSQVHAPSHQESLVALPSFALQPPTVSDSIAEGGESPRGESLKSESDESIHGVPEERPRHHPQGSLVWGEENRQCQGNQAEAMGGRQAEETARKAPAMEDGEEKSGSCVARWEGGEIRNENVSVPTVFSALKPLKGKEKSPRGHILIHDFISEEEEDTIIRCLDEDLRNPWKPSSFNGKYYGKAYGLVTDLRKRTTGWPEVPMPGFLSSVIRRMAEVVPQLKNFVPNETNAIDYRADEGAWIKPHVDDRQLSGVMIVNLSMGGACYMTYARDRGPPTETFRVLLPRRSLQVQAGESRYSFTHAIYNKDLIDRRRISLTFRQSKLPLHEAQS